MPVPPSSSSARIVDYIAVVAQKSNNNPADTVGRVIQRFPTTDWDDVPFFHGLEMFVCPDGYSSRTSPWTPRAHSTVLTDVHGVRHHCAIVNLPNKCVPRAEEEDAESTHSQSLDEQMMETLVGEEDNASFVPLCLVLVGRHAQFRAFKHCLTALCTMYIDPTAVHMATPPTLERIVCRVLTQMYLPRPGQLSAEYSLGLGDTLTIRAVDDGGVPSTGTCVAMLYKQLGTLHNLLQVVTALLCDKKIVLHCRSYTRLSDACHALVALMYPLKYPYAYVPIVPSAVMDILMLPTPFIMGVHASLKAQTVDQLQQAEAVDVVMVDLDYGSICVPPECDVLKLPQPYSRRLLNSLLLTVNGDLSTADDAFDAAGDSSASSSMFSLDKRIRGCFTQFFVEILCGYRKYLQVVRLYASPFITLHRAAFLGERGLQQDAFMRLLFEAQPMQVFIHERGVPYRDTDLFDELLCRLTIGDVQPMSIELSGGTGGDWPTDVDRAHHGKCMAIADKMMRNESEHMTRSEIVRPSEGRLGSDLPPFPLIDGELVTSLITASLSAVPVEAKKCPTVQFHAVPSVASLVLQSTPTLNAAPNERRLQVLRHCLQSIFDNRVTDARKIMSAVLLSMKTPSVRVELCHELHANSHPPTRATLLPPQFDLIVRLMNCALENSTADDEHGVAYALLILAQTYCRRLTPGMLQFAYTCVQEHPVWASIAFWQSVFYHDVNCQLRRLYMEKLKMGEEETQGRSNDLWALSQQPSALHVASNMLRAEISASVAKEREEEEENIIYSQALHYTNMMVCMRTPLDPSKLRHVNVAQLEMRAGGNVHAGHVVRKPRRTPSQSDDEADTTSNASSDTSNNDNESGYDERVHSRAGDIAAFPLPLGGKEGGDLGQQTVRFIAKFLDKISCDVGLPASHVTQLHNRLPAFVAAHIENLEQVYRESRRLPDMVKARLLEPIMASGERPLTPRVRAYLLPDGRNENALTTDALIDKTTGALATTDSLLLPAEGALYITNYRIVFKGSPCDPFACEQIVVRSMPLAAVTKVKRISNANLLLHTHMPLMGGGGRTRREEHTLHAALQIRSSTFQLMRLAFDSNDVSEDRMEELIDLIDVHRYVEHVQEMFPFSSSMGSTLTATVNDKPTAKSTKTMGGLARQTLLRTAKKAGFTTSTLGWKGGAAAALMLAPQTEGESVVIKDYVRLHLLDDTAKLRLCRLPNKHYALVRSYSHAFVVPAAVADDNLRKVCKGFKHGRLPIVTWQSARGALLMRGSAMHIKHVGARIAKATQNAIHMGQGLLDGHSTTALALPSNVQKTSVEQERYMNACVAISPVHNEHAAVEGEEEDTRSVLSVESIMFHAQYATPSTGGMSSMTERTSDKRGFPSHLASRLRSSHTKASTMMGGSKTLTTHRAMSNTRTLGHPPASTSLTRARLYIFGERHQSKTIKLAPNCEFIPVVYPTAHQCKTALTSMLRVCAPSQQHMTSTTTHRPTTEEGTTSEGDMACHRHMRALNATHWHSIVSQLLSLANAIVDVMDMQCSSVCLALEEGWDVTCQLACLSQLLLDGHYRTIDGLRTVIDKEWLSVGHRFAHRHNRTRESMNSGVAPIFLLFLDALHQTHRQFPGAFEYNDMLLRFLAYHSVSGHSKDFLFDTEAERLAGASADDVGVWDCVLGNRRVFVNDVYTPHLYAQHPLRPSTAVAALDLWTYYTDDPLAHGSPYDLECMEGECVERDECASLDVDIHLIGRPIDRQQVHYDYNRHAHRSGLCSLVEEVERLERDLGISSDGHAMQRAYEGATQGERCVVIDGCAYERYVSRALHKRFTVELLLHGKRALLSQQHHNMLMPAPEVDDDSPSVEKATYAHAMRRHHFNAPTYCCACDKLLWGVTVQYGLKCAKCDYAVHEQCSKTVGVPNSCTIADEVQEDTLNVVPEVSKSTRVSTHEGYLQKRDGKGGVLRQWRARYFVLDAALHELRYYESRYDTECRGVIDLATISQLSQPLVHKRAEHSDNAQIRCAHRVYTLMAYSKEEAEVWVDRIHQCLQ